MVASGQKGHPAVLLSHGWCSEEDPLIRPNLAALTAFGLRPALLIRADHRIDLSLNSRLTPIQHSITTVEVRCDTILTCCIGVDLGPNDADCRGRTTVELAERDIVRKELR
jgi:hypothetical protein